MRSYKGDSREKKKKQLQLPRSYVIGLCHRASHDTISHPDTRHGNTSCLSSAAPLTRTPARATETTPAPRPATFPPRRLSHLIDRMSNVSSLNLRVYQVQYTRNRACRVCIAVADRFAHNHARVYAASTNDILRYRMTVVPTPQPRHADFAPRMYIFLSICMS